MGAKPVHALAGLLLVGVSLTGCQSDRSSGGGTYPAPPVIGSGASYNPSNAVGSRPQHNTPVAGRYDMPVGPQTNSAGYQNAPGNYAGSVNPAAYSQMPNGGTSPMTNTPLSNQSAAYPGASPAPSATTQPYGAERTMTEMPMRPANNSYNTTSQPAPASNSWNTAPSPTQPRPTYSVEQ